MLPITDDQRDRLARLVAMRVEAKTAEQEAIDRRRKIDGWIAEIVQHEGDVGTASTSVSLSGGSKAKVSVKRDINLSCDEFDGLESATTEAGVFDEYIATKYVLKEAAIKSLRKSNPDLFALLLAPHITVRPASPSIEIKIEKN